ncbi:hypothetical protein R3W88_022768 [Solanum pinnatisectum]|uniref:Cytochrome P450 n=1 Tax=Solanum pinnatisectum TaxID=50273 RepID=A0AAV9LYL1_9SOLN|nr:hypothetical protein R3W88_022768 [Solanum pinnatisectum]
MHLKLGQRSTIVISSPQLAKEMMKTHDLTFANRPQLSIAKIMFYNCQDIAFSPYGDYWKQIRKICVMELLSTKNVTSFFPMMVDETYLLVNSIKAMSERPINISEKMYLLTSAIVCRASIGRTCKDQESVIYVNETNLFPSLKILHFISRTNRKLLQLHCKVDPVLERIINEHETEQLVTEHIGEDLVDNMLVAGSATSSTVLEWAMSELMKNPSMMEKAQNEVRDAFNGKTKIDQTDLKNLKIPQNGIVNMWALGKDSEYWEEAEKFEPERFNESPLDVSGNHFQFIPFGAGRRICPGINFSMASMELFSPQQLDMTVNFGNVASRKNNLYLLASPFVKQDAR